MSTITTINSGDTITSSRTVINTNFSNLNTDKIETSYLDTDTTLAGNSDSKIPTQKAVKAYVDALGSYQASKAGVSNGPASSTTQTITHSLGRIPAVIRMTGYGKYVGSSSSQGSGTSNGVYYTGGNYACIYLIAGSQAVDNSVNTSTTFAVYLSGLTGISTEVHASGTISNVTTSAFDIVWTTTGDTSAVTKFMWECN
jgi:hypothetical protein